MIIAHLTEIISHLVQIIYIYSIVVTITFTILESFRNCWRAFPGKFWKKILLLFGAVEYRRILYKCFKLYVSIMDIFVSFEQKACFAFPLQRKFSNFHKNVKIKSIFFVS